MIVSSYLFRGRLLDGDLLALDGVVLLEDGREHLLCAEDDEGEPPRPPRHRVHLQVHGRDLAEGGEVLADVLLRRFLSKGNEHVVVGGILPWD